MMLLGFIILLSPVFVIVSIRTGLGSKLWAKILNSVLGGFFIFMIFSMGYYYNQVEELEIDNSSYSSAIESVVDRDLELIECVDYYTEKTYTEDVMLNLIDNCIVPNIQEIRSIYED